MNAEEALAQFLNRALVRKKERYLYFLSSTKRHYAFLDAIPNKLENCLDPAKKVASLPAKALRMPGYRFAHTCAFGEPVESLGSVVDSHDDSFLVVSVDGRYGMHGPDDKMDDRAFYKV